MNIFEQYLDKIKKTLLDFSKKGDLILPDSLDGITAEIPPSKFNSDISTNVAMVLSKINKKPPIELANTLSEEIKKNDMKIVLLQVRPISTVRKWSKTNNKKSRGNLHNHRMLYTNSIIRIQLCGNRLYM